MTTRFFKRSLFARLIVFIIIANFILTTVPISAYSSSVFASDSLRQSATLKTENPGRGHLLDDLNADLHARAQATVARLPDGGKVGFHKYDKKKGGYVVEPIDKKRLTKLLSRDEIGLIEDEDNPGQYIWAQKADGAVITKRGELLISTRITYPTMQDVPINQIDLPRYAKVFPLAYWFFKTYLGKSEYAWISDILAKSKVLLVAPGSLGERHFSADRATKTIKIEKDFMDYILIGGEKRLLLGRGVFADAAAGQKRVGMGFFTEAAIAIDDKEIEPEKAKEIVNKIAQVSLTGNNRLEDAIYLFNLKKEIAQTERRLTPQERQYFLIDMMERNRGFNGRLAAKVLKETFEYYGEVTTEEAEADLREIANVHPDEVVIDKYDRDHETEEEKAAKYADRTDTFRLSGKHLADLSLIKDRRIVWDYEIDARDAPLFGGKVAYTGMMQWAPRVLTLPMFATAGVCFKEDLIKYNDYKDKFDKISKELKDGLETLNKKHDQHFIGDEEFAKEKAKLVRGTASMFQSKLDWGVAKISPELVKEIKEALTLLAKRTGTSLFQLILAIRSSAIGEDSETASFAGRQDTSLFVTILTEEFIKIGLKPEDYGYTWEDLKHSVFPWYDILNKARAKLGDRVITEQMLEVFVREWLANQRSLFNMRSIEYRLENNIPVFTDQVEMSSIFQEQANTEFGYVAFGVNRATGYPEIQMEIIEGQTNPLVDGSGTGDLVFVGYSGRDRFRAIQVPESRKTMHVPNIFGKAIQVEGETRKGGVISIDFPEELKGIPAITDDELLTQMGEVDAELTNFFGMYPDIEGGLIIRRDKKGNILFAEDILEPDGIAKDHFGKPRMLTIKFQTQIRPDATYNFKNPDVIEQHWLEVPDEEYQRAVREGKVLYPFSQAHTQGAAKGEVFILEKGRPETWYKALKKIMVTVQSDPDMNEAMRSALAVVAAVGGRNSHTMIVAIESGLIAISGIGDIDRFYNGQKVTVDATRGIILEGDDYRLAPAGNDYNVRLLGVLPEGFSLNLNVNSAELSQKGRAFRNKPDFKGIGLLRLEFLLELMKGAGEGFLRYDSYKIFTLLEKLDKGELSVSERNLLNKIFAFKGDIKYLRPRLEGNHIIVTINAGERTYASGLEFYRAHVDDQKYPRYRPEIPAELKEIKEFDKITQGFILGEERYSDILSRGIKSIVEPFMVDPLEILILSQRIQNPQIRHKALGIVDQYIQTYLEKDGALPTDEIIKNIGDLITSYEEIVPSRDEKLLKLVKRHLSRDFFIRFDDRKSDEYANVLGSMVMVDRNPMLGYRGIRLMLDHPKVTRMQLEAIKKVVDIGARQNAEGKFVGPGKYRMRVFSPIVYAKEHVLKMNELCDEAGLTSDRVQRGIMTETPQSAELRSFLEAGIDFTSTGGNDMLQLLEEVDRQNAAAWFNSITSRSIQSYRVLATLANETKKWNKEVRIPQGLKPVTAGYCGNWPADDPVGSLVLYLYGFDSASITIPSMDRTNNDLYRLLDHLYGRDKMGLLNVPEDKEEIVKDLYELMVDADKQTGLPKNLIGMLPVLKVALDQRHFNIYDQIDPDAKPEIKTVYSKGSVSLFHLQIPFHYRLLEEYDKGEKGDLFVKEAPEYLYKKIEQLKKELRDYESKFNQLKEKASKGKDVGKEISEWASKIKECNDGIEYVEYKLKSIEIKKLAEGFLKRAGYDIRQPGAGKKFYIASLKQLLRQQAEEAKERGEPFIIETAKEPADYVKLKLGGERYELPKEPNSDIGNRGMKKLLNPDKNIFRWDLEAIKELRQEGLDNIALALSVVREISEVDAVGSLLKEVGLTGIPLGIVANGPNLIYAYDYYLAKERGISFLLLDREAKRELAAAKRGTEWDNVNTTLITDKDVDETLADVTIPVTKTQAAKFGVSLYLSENPANKIADVYIRNKVNSTDTKVYNSSFVAEFVGMISALKDLNDKGRGALVIRANTLLENAGSLSVLKELKGTNPNFKIAIWANDEFELDKAMNIAGLADIISLGLNAALSELNAKGIPEDHIVLVDSNVDRDEVSVILKGKPELKVMNIDTAHIKELKINSMSLVIARAIAGIFKDEASVVNRYQELIRDYKESGQISEQDLARLTDLTVQISEVPLVKVSEDTAQAADTYRVTLGEVGGKV